MNDKPKTMPNVPPFVKFVCANVPMVFDDSLSYYEALCALWKYVQGMTDVINNNATLEEEYIEKFGELNQAFNDLKTWVETYFENLDVQEEINNKLDDMAEQGVLADIISQYLNSIAIFCYDSVADMKASENLIDGSYARTLGYHAKNDGGSALYKIRNITNDDVIDEATIIEMNDSGNNLIAELITNEYNFNQFGCYGDGVNDDTINLQKCITAGIANKKNIKGVSNCTYLVSGTINIDNANVDFANSTIKTDSVITDLLKVNVQDNTNFSDYYGVIENVIIDCTNTTNGLRIQMGRKKLIRNCKFINISNVGLYYQAGYEVTVKDCHFIAVGNADGGASADSIGIKASGGDSEFMDIVLINCFTAIDNGGFNMYRGIHAWIRTHSIAPTARMFNLHGNVGSLISQCYSDTYGITFNMEDAYASIDQLYVYFNSSIYENTYDAPKLFNNSQSRFTDYYQRQTSLTNSTLQGVSSSQKLTYVANSENIGIKVNYNNIKNVNGYNSYYRNATLTDKATTPNATIDASKIWVKNGFVNINLVFHIDTTISKSFTIGDLPAWAIPSYEYNGMCCYGNNNISDVDGVGYLKIYDAKIRGNVKNATANTAYVKINITYPILSEYTGS